MPWVRDLPCRSSRNNSLPVMAGSDHVMLGAGCASYWRPSASTDHGVGGRAPPRIPSIAATSIVAVPPILSLVLGVFFSLAASKKRSHAKLGASCASCQRPSASTDRGEGGRAPPRTPSIATASVLAVPPILLLVLCVFCQPRHIEEEERGGVLFVGPLFSIPVARRIGPSHSSKGATALSWFSRF